jgi:hypothetical protein
VQHIERDGYVELLFKGDSANFISNSDKCGAFKLLSSLSVCKRYIKKDGKITWLWSISTFARSGMTLEETISQVERELSSGQSAQQKLEEFDDTPRNNAYPGSKVIVRVPVTYTRDVAPKIDSKTGKYGKGIYLTHSEKPEYKKEVLGANLQAEPVF